MGRIDDALLAVIRDPELGPQADVLRPHVGYDRADRIAHLFEGQDEFAKDVRGDSSVKIEVDWLFPPTAYGSDLGRKKGQKGETHSKQHACLVHLNYEPSRDATSRVATPILRFEIRVCQRLK